MSVPTETLSSLGYHARSWPDTGTSETGPLRVPGHLAAVAAEFSQLSALAAGWNSYGAAPVRPSAIEAAVRVLVYAGEDMPLPSISPTPHGGIQLEWGGDDDGVEIEFEPDGSISVLVDVNGELDEHRVTGTVDPTLADALNWAAKLA